MIIHFDMDGVLCDIGTPIREGKDKSEIGFFLNLKPIPGAIQAFQQLSKLHECHILSTAPWSKPNAWEEKRLWVEEHLGEAAFKRLTLSHNKHLLIGDILIDDRTANGAGEFKGLHILFGQPPFETWDEVLAFILEGDIDAEFLQQELLKAIDRMLQDCDETQFPTICQMRRTNQGFDMAREYIAQKIASTDGMTIQRAIYETEQEYSINPTE